MLAHTRVLALVLALALSVFALAGCGGDDGGDTTDGGSTDGGGDTTASEPAITPANADELATYLQDTYGSEPWMSTFAGVSFTTALSRPVVQIAFLGTRDEVTIFEDDVLDPFYLGEIAVDANVEVWSEEGWTSASSFGTQPALGPLPDPPTSAGEVVGYLQSAYGPGGTRPTDERWVATVQGAELVPNNEGVRVLEVSTTLDSAMNPKDSYQVGLIFDALNEAGISDWADRMDVETGSGFTTTATTPEWTSRFDW